MMFQTVTDFALLYQPCHVFQAQYFGGEQRLDLGGGMTSVILAAEVTPNEALAAELLLTAMGMIKTKLQA